MEATTTWNLKLWASMLVVLVLAGAPLSAASQSFALPAPDTSALRRLSLWGTIYFVHSAEESVGAGVEIHGRNRAGTGVRLKVSDFCSAALEGTVRVTTRSGPRVYNYAGLGQASFADCGRYYPGLSLRVRRALGRSLFKEVPADAPFGLGVRSYRLVPYRTAAVDPSLIPFGSVLFIPGLRGREITLPDGRRAEHDGYLFAGDTGGAIKQEHIDVFTGVSSRNPAPAILRSRRDARFEAYLVTDPQVTARLRAEHDRAR